MDDGCRRGHPGNTPPRAHDDGAADALPQNAIRAADIAGGLRGDGGGLESQARPAHGGSGLADHVVARRPPVSEGEIEPQQLEVEAEDPRVEHAQRFVEQLLTGLVAIADDDLEA